MTKMQLLEDRRVLEISGPDKFKFLQGLVTNDVTKIEKKESDILYALMLTPQGKFLYDFFIFALEDKLFLDHDFLCSQEIISKFNIYKLRSQVSVNVSKFRVLFSAGKKVSGLIFEDPRSKDVGFRGYLNYEDLQNVDLSEGEYQKVIYEHIIPEPHKDMEQNKSFPVEFGMENYNAISFNKGCYLGQENTARMKHRGVVRKTMHQFISKTHLQDITRGTEILLDGVKIGIYCSSYGNIGKCLMRNDSVESYPALKAQLLENNIEIL